MRLSDERVLQRLERLVPLLAAFLTPLLFLTASRDQFELPKLVFLAFLGAFFLAFRLLRAGFPAAGPVPAALAALAAAWCAASLPGVSLSPSTSLVGEYENFGGLWTLALLLIWFTALAGRVEEAFWTRFLAFALLSGLLSALYALFQWTGGDFVTWNPDSIMASRKFASLGNPNFLSAYLAQVLPFLPAAALAGGRVRLSGRQILRLGALALAGAVLLLGASPTVRSAFGVPSSREPFFLWIPAGLFLLAAGLLPLADPRRFPAFAGVLLLLLFGLVSTESRGGFLGALVGLGTFGIFAARIPEARERLRALGRHLPRRALLPGILLALLALGAFGRGFLHRLLGTLTDFPAALSESRLHIWKPALAMVRENPVFGVGLDCFKIAFPAYATPEFHAIDGTFVSSRTAHNELLQAAATTGLIGLAASLAVIAAFLGAWRVSWRTASGNRRLLLAALLASAAAYHVQNLFSFGVAALNFLWFAALAAVHALHRGVPPERSLRARAPVPAVLLVLLTAALAGYGLLSVRRLTADFAFARGEAVRQALKEAPEVRKDVRRLYATYGVRMTKRALDLFSWDVKYRLYHALANETAASAAETPAEAREALQEATRHYEAALALSPANAYYHNNLGRVLEAQSGFLPGADPELSVRAAAAYRRAAFLAPVNPLFKVNWALTLAKLGRGEEAAEVLQAAFRLDADLSARLLAQAALERDRAGMQDEAERLLDWAVSLNGKSPVVLYYRGLLKLESGRTREALEDFRKARDLDPSLPGISGKMEEAQKKLE